jgi:hypothetical protein
LVSSVTFKELANFFDRFTFKVIQANTTVREWQQ